MTEEYMPNEAGDGYMPVCPKCHTPFEDSEIGDVKNYPEDGVVAVFFKCKKCGTETDFIYVPLMKNPDSYKIIKRPSD